MAAAYVQSSGRPLTKTPSRSARIAAAETNQIAYVAQGSPATGTLIPGVLRSLVIPAVGTTATLDLYDVQDAEANASPLFRWVTADGKGPFTINAPFARGLRAVYGGTPGEALVLFDI